MRKLAPAVSCLLAIGGSILLCMQSRSFLTSLIFVPFSLGPLLISAMIVCFLTNKRSQIILSLSSICYAGWFAFADRDIFYIHPDPQSPILFIFIGIYSLPIMAIFWFAAFWIDIRNRPLSIQKEIPI
ncbi:MAG: hypothetical protein V4507_03625 [Verrucomicrobiota bacterium]